MRDEQETAHRVAALSVALLETWDHTDNPDPEETL